MAGQKLVSQTTFDEPTSPVFDAGGTDEALYERARCRLPYEHHPWISPDSLEFDLFFFRQLFDHLVADDMTVRGKVHVTVLRSLSVKLLDTFGLDGLGPIENDFFGLNPNHEQVWFTWVDLCNNLIKVGHPVVKLNAFERIYMTLDMPDTSILAHFQMFVMLVVILVNLAMIVIQSLPQSECPHFLENVATQECGSGVQGFCMAAFSLEYLVKLTCSPFVRMELFDKDSLLTQAARAHKCDLWHKPAAGPLQRVWSFLINPMHLIDMVSILPSIITMVMGELLPLSSASFLRVLRIGRIFRILKTGRYLEMLQILATVIVRSMRSIMVLMIFVVIVMLLGGVLLEQTEPGEAFSTVPLACYWIGAHLINMKEVPGYKHPVQTVCGVTVVAFVMILKAVLWILPVGQMKGAYDEACKSSDKLHNMKEEVRCELTRPEWMVHAGLQDAVQAYLEVSQQHNPQIRGRAVMPVPILSQKNRSFDIEVHFQEGPLSRAWTFRKPASMTLHVRWKPDITMIKADKPALPHGRLIVEPLETSGFPGDAQGWSCLLRAPTGLAGTESEVEHVSQLTSRAHGPLFEGFWDLAVDWRLRHGKCKQADPKKLEGACDEIGDQQEKMRSQVALLEAQMQQLESLKARLQKLT
mmetsp:Transcript_46453/g.108167  ORF Transcript_46453/g.108167 Transcript_46453/m.108167 type:complete len:640 (+) Transcript_46453:84-2003(+)